MSDTTPPNVSSLPVQTKAQRVEAAEARLNKRRAGYAHSEYFKLFKEGAVWIQNLTDMQISLDIEVGPNQTHGKLVPPSPDPIDLTEEYSYEVLSKSANFRKALAKRRGNPPKPDFILLDTEQVEAYFSAKAKMMNAMRPDGSPDLDIAMASAEETRKRLTTRQVDGEHVSPTRSHNFAPPKSAQELISMDLAARGLAMTPEGVQVQRTQAGGFLQQGAMHMQEVVSAKVLHLCLQVSPQIPEAQRMPADDFVREIQAAARTIDDWQHVEAHGTWRTAKKLARQMIAQLAASGAEDGVPDGLSLMGHQQVAQAQNQGALMAVPQGFGPQGPATLGQQQGMQYAGPTGFVNASFKEAHGAAESMTGAIIGPNGRPLGE